MDVENSIDEENKKIDEENKKIDEYNCKVNKYNDALENGIIEDSIHMPLGLCIRNVKKKQIDDMRDKKICTYCGTGYRGNIAADELNKERFHAVTLDGGYSTWI